MRPKFKLPRGSYEIVGTAQAPTESREQYKGYIVKLINEDLEDLYYFWLKPKGLTSSYLVGAKITIE